MMRKSERQLFPASFRCILLLCVGTALAIGPARGQDSQLDLAMTATPDPVSPGGQVTYQITVTNQSAEEASSVDVRSVIPAHTDAKEDNTDGDCPSDFGDEFACNAGETIQFDVGDLPAGESAVVSYAAQVRTGDEAPPEGTVLDGNATASSFQGAGPPPPPT